MGYGTEYEEWGYSVTAAADARLLVVLLLLLLPLPLLCYDAIQAIAFSLGPSVHSFARYVLRPLATPPLRVLAAALAIPRLLSLPTRTPCCHPRSGGWQLLALERQ